MGLLKVEFNARYRFRRSRSANGVARCRLCCHNSEGYCTHPERARRVILSDPPIWSGRERYDLQDLQVCDRVEIPTPETVTTVDLEPGYGLRLIGKLADKGPGLLHSDPLCPCIIAKLLDEKRSAINGDADIREFSKWADSSSYILCELCGKGLGIRQGRHDYYLREQGIDDGYVYIPPEWPTILDDGPYENFASYEVMVRLWSGGMDIHWTEEQALDAVRRVKGLIQHPYLSYAPPTETHTGHRGIEWHHMRIILQALGWREIADRIDFEKAVREQGILYCIPCTLSRDVYGPQENPVRRGCDPHCPTCGSQLVSSSTHANAMPE